MSTFKHDVALRAVKAADACIITLPFIACWFLYYAKNVASPYYAKGNLLVVAIFLILFIMIGRIYDAFWISGHRVSEIVYAQVLTIAACDSIMYLIIWLLSKHLPNLIPGLMAFAAQCTLAVIWALSSNHWYYRNFLPIDTAIVYETRLGMQGLINEYGMNKKYDVKKTLTVDAVLKNLDLLSDVKTVFLSGVHSRDRNVILKYCIANNKCVFVIPRVGDVIMSGARPVHMFHLPMLQVSRYMANPEYLFIKRFMDILLSLTALIVASPVMIITAIMIKAEDHGPILYKQTRLTKDGKEFEILKFRSMRVDAEKDGVARLSTGDNDSRITKVGHFIRKCRIDELPQLINILEGSLSICGPRPERPEIAAQYCKEMPEFALRLQAKAGLTGYAQVYGKYNTTPYDKLQMDLMYIAKPSIIEDLKIMFGTVGILFLPESTEGVAEGQTTAMSGENH